MTKDEDTSLSWNVCPVSQVNSELQAGLGVGRYITLFFFTKKTLVGRLTNVVLSIVADMPIVHDFSIFFP